MDLKTAAEYSPTARDLLAQISAEVRQSEEAARQREMEAADAARRLRTEQIEQAKAVAAECVEEYRRLRREMIAALRRLDQASLTYNNAVRTPYPTPLYPAQLMRVDLPSLDPNDPTQAGFPVGRIILGLRQLPHGAGQ